MAESQAEAMVRQAKERKEAAEKAAEAQKKADLRAAEDEKVAQDKKRQEAEEAAADLEARRTAAADLAAQNNSTQIPGISAVTPNAAGAPAPRPQAQTAEIELAPVLVDKEIGLIENPWRTFQHLYANANTIMPDGKKIIFGGQNGHTGQYSTNQPEQIEHLVGLSNTPGSMVSEVRQDREGRYIVVNDAILEAERQAALIDSRKNTAHQQSPGVAQAISNLGRTIAQDS